MKNRYCVIMAGGIGARFWPMSRTSHPKQFIDILGTGKTLIQQTFERFSRICPKENILVVTNSLYKEMVIDQLPEIDQNNILCEPARRNTAPCIAYANHKIHENDQDAIVVVAPSDHIILKEDVFTQVVNTALEAAASNNWLLTLGIEPNRPDTGYGYIQYMEGSSYHKDYRIKKVKTFTEKPNLEMAESFLKSGDFLWNSGIFIWSLQSIQKAFKQYLEDIDNIFAEGKGIYNTPGEDEFIRKAYEVCRNISIDYGVMEKADNVYVVASDFGWSDLGTWGSLYAFREKNELNNAVAGKNVLTYDTTNCIVNVPKDKLVVLQGLNDYIVVEDEGILLVCRMQDEQKIRQIVNDVRVNKGEKYV